MAHGENSLPREVLRWAQGLDLSYAIRNVKRDFANGFLVAEILSRYYEGEVDVHCFNTGISMTSKKDNWFLLHRFFAKVGVECSYELANEIMHAKTGSAARFVEYLYTVLTDRELPERRASSGKAHVPRFARATASKLIKKRLNDPDMLINGDQVTTLASAQQVLEEHSSRLQLERLSLRQSFESKSSGGSSHTGASGSGSGNSRSLGMRSSDIQRAPRQQSAVNPALAAGVQVKEVRVKQLHSDASALRARKRINDAMQVEPSRFGAASGKNQTPKQSTSLLRTFGKLVPCEDTELERQPLSRRIFVFVDRIVTQLDRGNNAADGAWATVLEQIAHELDEMDHPVDMGEFWAACAVLSTVFEAATNGSELFEACQDAFSRLGQLLLRQVDLHRTLPHRRAALDYFFDMAMPRLLPMIRSDPEKRRSALLVLCSFADLDAETHIYMIHKLHKTLNDLGPFLHCLTILIFLEPSLSLEDEHELALLDLYAYYALIGISNASAPLRASSLAMVAVIVQHDASAAARLLPRLALLADDAWWEVQCQLLIVCSKIIDELPPVTAPTTEEAAEARTECLESTVHVITQVFHTQAPEDVQKVGLAFLAQHIDKHDLLQQAYVQVLCSLAQSGGLESLLGFEGELEELPVKSACGGAYHLAPLPSAWQVTAVAAELRTHVEAQKLERLENWHFVLLEALAQPPAQVGDGEEKDGGGRAQTSFQEALFETWKQYCFVGLCDPSCASRAAALLKIWQVQHTQPVLADPAFAPALTLLFAQQGPQGEAVQRCAADLLLELFDAPACATEARHVVSKLCAEHPELLRSDILCEVEART